MKKKINNKIKTITMVIVGLSLIIMFLWVYPLANQVDKPISVLIAIFKLNMSDSKIIEYDDSLGYVKHITKTKDGSEPMIDLMESKGWLFKDQMGSGFIFEKDDEMISISSTQFTRYYRLWKSPRLQ